PCRQIPYRSAGTEAAITWRFISAKYLTKNCCNVQHSGEYFAWRAARPSQRGRAETWRAEHGRADPPPAVRGDPAGRGAAAGPGRGSPVGGGTHRAGTRRTARGATPAI